MNTIHYRTMKPIGAVLFAAALLWAAPGCAMQHEDTSHDDSMMMQGDSMMMKKGDITLEECMKMKGNGMMLQEDVPHCESLMMKKGGMDHSDM